MEIDLTTLLKGKGTQIKGKEYLPTAAYVEPFLERMQKYTSDFRVQVKTPNQLAIDNTEKFYAYEYIEK